MFLWLHNKSYKIIKLDINKMNKMIFNIIQIKIDKNLVIVNEKII